MSEQERRQLANLFMVFSDSNRLKILEVLMNRKINVTKIAEETSLSVSNVSHQLKQLEFQRVVKKEKLGKYVYYSLDDRHILRLLEIGLKHIDE